MQQTQAQPDLTVIVPAYREEKRIGKTLDELSVFLKSDVALNGKTVEVLVVSANSTDKTHEIVLAKQKQFTDLKLLKPGKQVGKGRDVQYGMVRAQGAAIIFMDADLATPLKYLPKFYSAYLKGSDVVIATRNLRKHHPNPIRRLISNGGNLLFRVAGGVWVEDSQCGFKLFSHDAAQLCFSKLTIMGWGFDMEVLAIAKANNLKITSYRVNDWVSVPEGTFVEGMFANSFKSLQELARILSNRIRRTYVD
ncbi:MAG: glycosyl transferase family protein [Candidatus Saccharibacteria bacterium]|nr:glycosyl transferase family protein [Candidatus Saccharibacteria bacterium]